jgi:hypothetical protein
MRWLFILLCLLGLTPQLAPFVNAADEPPPFPLPLAAPWPAGYTWHAAGDGSGYGENKHKTHDEYAIDFNGNPGKVVAGDPDKKEKHDTDVLVLAVADGQVQRAQCGDGGYGCNVIISHNADFQTRYAHLKDKPLVKVGDMVTQGQPLGQVGSTGLEPHNEHLHFVIYYCKVDEKKKCIYLSELQSVKPEPLEKAETLDAYAQVTSANYGVGYEVLGDGDITTTTTLASKFHKPIYKTYQSLWGQYYLFGRAASAVTRLGETEMFYQEFAAPDHRNPAIWSDVGSAILQVGEEAYYLPEPVWKLYKGNHTTYGAPNSAPYEGLLNESNFGYRLDLQNASITWETGQTSATVLTAEEAPWRARFCEKANEFTCKGVARLDPYIKFSFPSASTPGPVSGLEGFSAEWEAKLAAGLINILKITIEVQGHTRIYVEDRPETEWINSPDAVTRKTDYSLHLQDNRVRVRFWQNPDKSGLLKVTATEVGLIGTAFADGTTLISRGYEFEPHTEFASFPTPPYPGDDSVATPSPVDTAVAPFTGSVVDNQDAAFQKSGTASYWQVETGGYGGLYMWTRNNSQTVDNVGQWTLNLAAGKYEIFVYVPSLHATTAQASYEIRHAGQTTSVVVSQVQHPNVWVSLGVYNFDGQTDEYVQLSDATGEPDAQTEIAFDAIGYTAHTSAPWEGVWDELTRQLQAWWNEQIESLRRQIEQWVQEQMDRFAQEAEHQLQQWLTRQCSAGGAALLLPLMALWLWRRKK